MLFHLALLLKLGDIMVRLTCPFISYNYCKIVNKNILLNFAKN